MSVFLLVAFFGLSMLGVPLAIALALASVGTLWLFTSMPMDLLSQTMFSSMNSFLLVAVPLFILVLFFQRQIVSGLTAGAVKG